MSEILSFCQYGIFLDSKTAPYHMKINSILQIVMQLQETERVQLVQY